MGKKTKAKADTSAADTTENVDSLFGSSKKVDPALASLFASSTPWKPSQASQTKSNGKTVSSKSKKSEEESNEEELSSASENEGEDAGSESEADAWSSVSSEEEEDSESEELGADAGAEPSSIQPAETASDAVNGKTRRKRKRDDEDLESKYMQRLAEEEAREESKREQERVPKRQKASEDDEAEADANNEDEDEDEDDDVEMADAGSEDDDEEDFQIPQHESTTGSQTPEIEKANRTVFLANVSSDTVTSKSAKKTLIQHMSSILDTLPKEKTAHKVESMRFRSTAYTNMLPKKASFVTQDLMDSTTKSTNAYVVYTTKVAAREALKLNGSVVLGRHLRVDSVAHPAKTEPRKCVFVGNLGFVDDESAIQAADAEEGNKKRKPRKKQPSDIEEGLWREFGKCGTVENVRVVRDSKTRVGKGFAYVQFADENAVEAALLYDGKRFPPMLPRKLRVSRAKGMKRNATKKDTWSRPAANGVYNPKVSGQQKSAIGRASKLLGRAGAALSNRPDRSGIKSSKLGELKAPESFVFEGHRATAGTHTSKKKRGTSKQKGKPNNRSTRRATAWKTGGA